LEPLATDVRLPVRQIRDANLTWVRRDAESFDNDDDLLTSLDNNGLMLPLLLTEELVVVDGARRFARLEWLGWRDVPVLVTTDWPTVCDFYRNARDLEAGGLPHDPMTWAEVVDLVSGPIEQLYQHRRLERWRTSRATRLASGAPPGRHKSGTAKRESDYIAEVAQALGWRQADLRTIREIYWNLEAINIQEALVHEDTLQTQGAAAAKALLRYADELRADALRLETGDSDAMTMTALLKKVKWVAAGKDLVNLRTGKVRRKFGEPNVTERKAVIAADPTATGRELDTQTLARLSQALEAFSIEADAYTHLRPSVRADDARNAAKAIRAAVSKFNRLSRVVTAYADYLEKDS
jgi:hypothetical protein